MSIATDANKSTESDEAYAELEQLIRARSQQPGPLFTTSVDTGALWGHYLFNLPEERRQHYNCHECRRFLQRFGGLAVIDANGARRTLLWEEDAVPPFFRPAVNALRGLVEAAKITGVFYADDWQWGTARTGEWSHLAGENKCENVLSTAKLKKASERSAERLEEFKMLQNAFRDYQPAVTAEAVRLLKSTTLNRPEKALAVAEWFHARQGATPNQIWHSVATAPVGFCHVRSGVIGTLLDDIKEGFPFDQIQRRWNEKLDPLAYQRPQAPPKAQAIEQAEKLVEQLGVARSLERRFATLADVTHKLWEPKSETGEKNQGGVFGHLKKQEVTQRETPPVKITWAKFARDVLPTARALEVRLPYNGNFFGLVTAVHPDAPNIFQWDNPVSWYVYSGGSHPSQWGLSGFQAEVTAVFLGPPQWGVEEGRHKHQGRRVGFALKGAKDSRSAGLALFPETLRSDFHGIRSVIEAHSRRGTIQGREQGNANGLLFTDQGGEVTVRVDGLSNYTICLWD